MFVLLLFMNNNTKAILLHIEKKPLKIPVNISINQKPWKS